MIHGVVAVLGALSTLMPGSAHAQEDAERAAAAQALYDVGATLLEQGKLVEACPKLAEVVQLIPEGIGAKLTLADCYEKSGKLASAWSQYSQASSLAGRQGQAERQAKADKKVAELLPKLATLAINVPDAVKNVPGVIVTRNNVPVGPAQWGDGSPVDIGEQVVTVKAPTKRTWTKTIEVIANGVKLEVDVPELEADEGAAGAGATSASGGSGLDFMAPVGIAVGATGLAALTISAIMGGLAGARLSDSEEPGMCDAANRCSQAGLDLRDEALVFADTSTGLLVTGLLLTAGGTVMFLLSPGDEGPGESPEPAVSLLGGPGWMGVKCDF